MTGINKTMLAIIKTTHAVVYMTNFIACLYVTGRPCCKSLCLNIIIIIMYYTYYDIYVRILSFLVWTDTTPSNERISELKPYQRINHFPGMGEICRKDSLARNMAKYD